MSKMGVIIKREFTEFVQTRTFLIMTVIGPLLMAGLIGIEAFVFTRAGGGEFTLTIVDKSPEHLGDQVATMLTKGLTFPLAKKVRSAHFETTVIAAPADTKTLIDKLTQRVQIDSLSGYLIIPAGTLNGDTATYYGKNATNIAVTVGLQRALQQAVQSIRLSQQGIDPLKVATALKPVQLESQKIGKHGLEGSAEARQALGYFMIFTLYLVTLLYGQAIMNSVLEEKRDKIVEVIVSSTRPSDLMIGKVIGIGAGGFLQMLIWVGFATLLLKYGPSIAGMLQLGASKSAFVASLSEKMPHVPLSVGLLFLLFFVAGFFIYSTMFAMIGSVVTTNQEAQQLVFPTIMPFIIGMFMGMTTLTNPDGQMAVWGSFIPLTAPIVMPARTVLGTVSPLEITLSIALTFATGFLILWVAAKVYRIGIFATGKKPTLKELVHWVRDA